MLENNEIIRQKPSPVSHVHYYISQVCCPGNELQLPLCNVHFCRHVARYGNWLWLYAFNKNGRNMDVKVNYFVLTKL